MRFLFFSARFSEHIPAFSCLTLLLLALLCSRPIPTRAASDTIGVDWVQTATLPSPYAYGLQQMVSFNDRLWIFGGVYNEPDYTKHRANASWSSADGITWTTASTQVPFLGVDDFDVPIMVEFNGKLWAMRQSQVWNSSNGLDWTQVSTSAPFEPGDMTPSSATIWDEEIYVYQNGKLYHSPDGQTWSTSPVPPPNNQGLGGSIVSFNSSLWFMNYNNVYYADDTLQWKTVNSVFPVPGFPGLVLQSRLYCPGETSMTSTYDGVHWRKIESWFLIDKANPRLASFKNNVWVTAQSIIWRSNLSGPPQIAPLSGPQRPFEQQPFVAEEPDLLNGVKPITWSLQNAPANMQVDAVTGIVTWAKADIFGTTTVVSLIASNGNGQNSVSMTFLPQVENATTATTPLFSAGDKCTVTWADIPHVLDYTVEVDDTPDFATPITSATVAIGDSTDHAHTFSGLQDGQTYYYRVRGNKPAPMTSLWSNVTSCTQDAMPPQFSFAEDITNAPPALSRLNLSALDPGSNPSGLSDMRVSTSEQSWMPYQATLRYVLRSPSAQTILIEVRDNVGNVTSHSLSITPQPLPPTLWVDHSNSSGYADGSTSAPFSTISAALAAPGPKFDIAVVQGTYEEYIDLPDNVRLTGGYPFVGASRSDPEKYPTTLTKTEFPIEFYTVRAQNIEYCILRSLTLTRGNATSPGHIVYFDHVARAKLQHCTIEGLAMYRPDVENPTFPRGTPNVGAGISVIHSTAELKDCRIRNNSSCTGGGLWASGNSSVSLQRCRLEANSVYSQILLVGGGMGVPGTRVTYEGTGGCIYLQGNSSVALFESIIADSAPATRLADGSSMSARNSLYMRNSPLLTADGNLSFYGCTVSGSPVTNIAPTLAQNSIFYHSPLSLQNAQFTDCAVDSSSSATLSGTNMIFTDPKFIDATHGDYRLAPDSPCIDSGSAMPGVTADLIGTTRPLLGVAEPRGDGSRYDIGAYEYQPLTADIIASGALHSGSIVAVKWRSDFVFSGSAVRIELWSEHGLIALLQTAWNSSAQDTTSVQLPLLAPGHTYFIRVRSDYDPQVFADAPLAISFDGNAAANWTAYD